MKNTTKILLAALSFIMVLAACTKEPPLFDYASGVGLNLKLQSANLTPAPSDSNNYVLRVNWTNPKFATDLSNVKFITQVAMAGTNFASPIVSEVMGVFGDSMQAKMINTYLLGKGAAFGATVPLETRVVTAYSNNNDMQYSNVVPFTFRVYKIPPKVALPASNRLFIVGSATKGGWNLPLINSGVDYSASQEFIRVNETTYASKIFLYSGESYLMVPLNNGSGWDLKYAITNSSAPNASTSGPFGQKASNAAFDVNFPSPAADGWYKMTFDFQTGNYTVVDSKDTPVPDSLYAIGDATMGGWDNSNGNNNLKAQYFRKLNAGIFEQTLFLNAGAQLKFITKITQWQPQFGKGANVGQLGYNYGGGSDPGSIIIPAVSGNYKVQVDFLNMTYTLTKL